MGRCEQLPAACSRNASWCDGGSNPDSEAVEELMALQLTKAGLAFRGLLYSRTTLTSRRGTTVVSSEVHLDLLARAS